jgi:hypothetical protein
MRILDTKSRFERHIEKSRECWLWTGSKLPQGYGSFGVAGKNWKSWKVKRAHRVSYELYIGPIPPGLDVLHHCDNPPCVRPSHLFLGTDFDNQQDCKRKGRRYDAKGIRNPNVALTEDNVKDIRNFHPVLSAIKLANHFGVKRAAIHKIIHYRTWKALK